MKTKKRIDENYRANVQACYNLRDLYKMIAENYTLLSNMYRGMHLNFDDHGEYDQLFEDWSNDLNAKLWDIMHRIKIVSRQLPNNFIPMDFGCAIDPSMNPLMSIATGTASSEMIYKDIRLAIVHIIQLEQVSLDVLMTAYEYINKEDPAGSNLIAELIQDSEIRLVNLGEQ